MGLEKIVAAQQRFGACGQRNLVFKVDGAGEWCCCCCASKLHVAPATYCELLTMISEIRAEDAVAHGQWLTACCAVWLL